MTSRCTFEYEGRLYWSVLRLRPGQGPGTVISGGLSQALRMLAGLRTHSSGSFCATPGRTLRVVKSRVGARRTPRSILECHVSRACMFFVVFVHVDIRASCEHLVSILCASCCILCASLHVFFFRSSSSVWAAAVRDSRFLRWPDAAACPSGLDCHRAEAAPVVQLKYVPPARWASLSDLSGGGGKN